MTDPKSPAAEMLTPLFVAFQTLIDETSFDASAPEDDLYEATLTFTYDPKDDVIGIDTGYSHDPNSFKDLPSQPDCFQMMIVITTEFLERVGALSEDEFVNEDFIQEDGSALVPPTQH